MRDHILRLPKQNFEQLLLPDRAFFDDGAFQPISVYIEEVHSHHRVLHLNAVRDYRVFGDIRIERLRGGLQFLVSSRRFCKTMYLLTRAVPPWQFRHHYWLSRSSDS